MVLIPLIGLGVLRCNKSPFVEGPHLLESELVQVTASEPRRIESMVSTFLVMELYIFPGTVGSFLIRLSACPKERLICILCLLKV